VALWVGFTNFENINDANHLYFLGMWIVNINWSTIKNDPSMMFMWAWEVQVLKYQIFGTWELGNEIYTWNLNNSKVIWKVRETQHQNPCDRKMWMRSLGNTTPEPLWQTEKCGWEVFRVTVFEPRAFNLEFQHFIPIFKKISLL